MAEFLTEKKQKKMGYSGEAGIETFQDAENLREGTLLVMLKGGRRKYSAQNSSLHIVGAQ